MATITVIKRPWILIQHVVQSSIFSVVVVGGGGVHSGLKLHVTTTVTKRLSISIAQIIGFSGIRW